MCEPGLHKHKRTVCKHKHFTTVRAGSHISISSSINIHVSIRKVTKVCVNRGYISTSVQCVSISISTRNGTFSIFICLCIHLCSPGSHILLLFFLCLYLCLCLCLCPSVNQLLTCKRHMHM